MTTLSPQRNRYGQVALFFLKCLFKTLTFLSLTSKDVKTWYKSDIPDEDSITKWKKGVVVQTTAQSKMEVNTSWLEKKNKKSKLIQADNAFVWKTFL